MATPTDLFISEYIEGSSNNKAIELFNGTGAPIDLAAGGYVLQLYSNGAIAPTTTFSLTGTVANGDVFVVANPSANATILAQADTTSTVTNYNGDDVILLRRGGATGDIVDVIGQVGADPGTEYGSGLTSTADNTLRRKPNIDDGDENGADAFDPAIEFDGFPNDTFDDLGSHTFTGGGGVGGAFAISAVNATQIEDATTYTFAVTRSGGTGPASVSYSTGAAGDTATAGQDYTAVPATQLTFNDNGTQQVSITILDDSVDEPDETFSVVLSNPTNGATVGPSATGTIIDNDLPPANAQYSIAPATLSQNEGNTGATTYNYTVTRTGPTGDATVTYTVAAAGAGDAAEADDIVGGFGSRAIAFTGAQTTATIAVEVNGDTVAEANEGFTLTLDGASGDGGIVPGQGSAVGTIVNDDVAITRISAVQGSGARSTFAPASGNGQGQTVTVEAIVVGDFQNGDGDASRNLNGFYLQEEISDQDANPLTSEGIFIFQGTGATNLPDVAEGARVRVTGTVSEFFGATQITAQSVTVIDPIAVSDIDTLRVDLDIPTDLEAFEGMLVRVPESLVITEQFNLDRFNEIRLYAPEGDGLGGAVDENEDGRPFTFTQTNEPDPAGFAAHRAAIAARSIVYDDGLGVQNAPIDRLDGFQGYSTATAPQMGDTITGLNGILDFSFDAYRVRAVDDGDNTVDRTANEREAAPAPVGGALRVGSFNVLNFFTTLNTNRNDDFSNPGDPSDNIDNGQDPRGANSEAEFDRQLEKLLTAIEALDVDILGLVELENDFGSNGGSAQANGNAIQFLVDELNTRAGTPVYSAVVPANPDPSEFVGTDAISTGFIYRNDVARLAPGTTPIAIEDPAFDRPPVFASFEEIGTGGVFTAVVNHFKSKGGSGTGADADDGDGQGAFNAQRTGQSTALLDLIDARPTGAVDPDYMILGDLNAYLQEEPIDVLRTGGFTPVQQATDYSFTFDGQVGTLDYVLTNATLGVQLTGFTEFHINADEADALDYNLDFGRVPGYFDASVPYRVSDHDPVIVGLNLVAQAPVITSNGGGATAAISVTENQTAVTTVAASDPDGTTPTFALAGGADQARFTIDAATGVLRFLAAPDFEIPSDADANNVYDLVVRASDTIRVDDQAIAITVTDVNDTSPPTPQQNRAPVAAPDAASAVEDGGPVVISAASLLANDTDPDAGDTRRIVSVTAAGVGAVSLNAAGDVVYDPGANFQALNAGESAIDRFTYTIADAAGARASGTVTVTVAGADEPPPPSAAPPPTATSGNDDVSLGRGDDVANFLEGDDTVRGDEGNDNLAGNQGNDRLFGGAGNDDLRGDDGEDAIDGGDGRDAIDGGSGVDRLFGGRGDDDIHGNEGDDLLEGQAGRDRMGGDGGNDRLAGGDDGDTLFGGTGDDTLYGDAGDDELSGEDGQDVLEGGSGNDRLFGNNGEDTLRGNDGDDDLFGGQGNDRLEGGDGDDELRGEAGDEVLNGGRDADTFLFDTNFRSDRIEDFGSQDFIQFSRGVFADFGDVMDSARQSGGDTVIDAGGGNILTLQSVSLASLQADDFRFV